MKRGTGQGRRTPPLHERPGFLVRRLHQIHVAMFAEACVRFGITPVQYSLLSAVAGRPGIDLAALGAVLGIDRSNTADVLGRLVRAGLVHRATGTADRRTRVVRLSPRGAALLRRLDPAAMRAHDRLLETLGRAERAQFLRLLQKLVRDRNEFGRVPLELS